MKQISRISPCVFTNQYDEYNNPLYNYNEEIIVGADAARYRNGEGSYSCVMGQGTESTTSYQTVVGKYNATNENALFLIGNGTSSAKSNIVEVYTNKFTINKNLEVKGTSYFADNIEVFGNGTFTNVYTTTATINKLDVESTATVKRIITEEAQVTNLSSNSLTVATSATVKNLTVNSNLIVNTKTTVENLIVNTKATIKDLVINNHITRNNGTETYITNKYAYSKDEVNDKIDYLKTYIDKEINKIKEIIDIDDSVYSQRFLNIKKNVNAVSSDTGSQRILPWYF